MKKLFISALATVALLSSSACSKVESIANPATTSTPKFDSPIGCTLGKDCFVLLYTDRDPGPSAIDFGCGRLTYDKHTGTDFAIPDEQVMAKGVPVLAAADGIVLRVRDGVVDRKFNDTAEDRQRIDGKDCGNGMVIDHGNGWETQYCHLRQNSVVVQSGTPVKAGTKLGLVGESGVASFPHVHFEVRYQGKPIDPFLGPNAATGCKVSGQSLWKPNFTYVPTGIMNSGFTEHEPSLEAAEKGTIKSDKLSTNSPMLIFWVRSYGVLQGDIESLKITAPDGSVAAQSERPINQSRRVWLSYAGKRRKTGESLMAGIWRSQYSIKRGQQIVVQIEREVKVE